MYLVADVVLRPGPLGLCPSDGARFDLEWGLYEDEKR